MLAVIPARGGSRGIYRKNLAMCGGRTLLQRAIDCAKQLTPHVVVSTDDDEIDALASIHGAKVIRAYPPLCHGDKSLGFDVWKHAFQAVSEPDCEWSIYLEPTAPLRTPYMLRKLIKEFKEGGVHYAQPLAFTVEDVPAKYHAARQFNLSGFAAQATLKGPHAPRQHRRPTFVKNGLLYIAHRRFFDDMWSVLPNLIPTLPTVNIDTYRDLEEAHLRVVNER